MNTKRVRIYTRLAKIKREVKTQNLDDTTHDRIIIDLDDIITEQLTRRNQNE